MNDEPIFTASARLLSPTQVAQHFSIHVRTFRRYLRDGRLPGFPEPIVFTDGCRRYRLYEIEAWLRQLPANSPLGILS